MVFVDMLRLIGMEVLEEGAESWHTGGDKCKIVLDATKFRGQRFV